MSDWSHFPQTLLEGVGYGILLFIAQLAIGMIFGVEFLMFVRASATVLIVIAIVVAVIHWAWRNS